MGKVISTIIVFLLAPLFFVFVFFLSLKLTVMNPDFVKKELSQEKIYEKIHANLLEVVSAIGTDNEVKSTDQGALTGAEITVAIQKTVTPEIAKKNTELAIDAFWPWIFGGKSENNTVDIKELKAHARTSIMDALKTKYESLPYCLSTGDFSQNNMVCRPKGLRFDDIMKQISNDPNNNPLKAIDDIPDNLNPDTLVSDSDGPLTKITSVRSSARNIFNFFYLIPVIFLIIFILLARLFAGAWKKVPKALGIFFIILGLVSFLLGLLLSKFGFSGIPTILDKSMKDLPGLKTQVIIPITKDILEKVGGTMNTVSISLLVAGIVFMGGSIILLKVLSKDDKTGI